MSKEPYQKLGPPPASLQVTHTVARVSDKAQGLRLVLDVMEKDAAALRLYERLGWRLIETTSHDSGRGEDVSAYCYVSPAKSETERRMTNE